MEVLKAFGLCIALYIAFLMGVQHDNDRPQVKYYLSKDVVFAPEDCRDHINDGKTYFVAIDDKSRIGVTSNGVSFTSCAEFFAMFTREIPEALTAPGLGD